MIAIWDKPTPTVLKQLRQLAQAKEPLVRWEAINALCRLADEGSVEIFVKALSDDTLMVRRAAAQALREVITRHPRLTCRPQSRRCVRRSDAFARCEGATGSVAGCPSALPLARLVRPN
jgi:hypothetical protein